MVAKETEKTANDYVIMPVSAERQRITMPGLQDWLDAVKESFNSKSFVFIHVYLISFCHLLSCILFICVFQIQNIILIYKFSFKKIFWNFYFKIFGIKITFT